MNAREFDKLIQDQDPMGTFDFSTESLVLENGRVIVARVAPLNDEFYILMLPMMLDHLQTGNTVKKTLVPFNTGSEDIFMPLRKSFVVCSGYVEQNLHNFYEKTVEEIMDDVAAEEIPEEEVQAVKAAVNKKLH